MLTTLTHKLKSNQLFMQGLFYLNTDQPQAAFAAFEQAQALGHDDTWQYLGQLHEQHQRIEKAAIAYATGPNNPVCHAEFQRLVNAHTNNWSVLHHYGQWLARHQQWRLTEAHYRAVAERGLAEGWMQLAQLYQQDRLSATRKRIVQAQPDKVLRYYRRAATLYHAPALAQLITLSETTAKAAIELAALFDQPDWPAMNHDQSLAYSLQAIRLGDTATLNKLWQQAEQGDSQAQYHLGTYFYGQGRHQDTAIYWCILASNHGEARATHYLDTTAFSTEQYEYIAKIYRQGQRNTRQNHQRAAFFYQKASDAGSVEATFLLGQLAEMTSLSLTLKHHALTYYLLADQQGHPHALTNALAWTQKHPNAEHSWMLAQHLTLMKYPHHTTLPWYLLANQLGHPQAITYLESTQFNASILYAIGQYCQQGPSPLVADNALAMYFYQRAAQQGYSSASYILAQHYRQQFLSNKKATQYYLIANQQGHPTALVDAIAWVEDKKNQYDKSEQLLMLARYYESIDNNLAIPWYLRAAYYHNTAAQKYIAHQIKAYPKKAIIIANYLETGQYTPINATQSMSILTQAALLGHEKTVDRLQKLADAGNVSAQYQLGTHYYPTKQQWDKAIHYSLLAAQQQHPHAIHYLHTAPFDAQYIYHIGECYEQGKRPLRKKDNTKARWFYEKAAKAGHSAASYRLAQWYQQRQSRQTLHYLLLAANQQHPTALSEAIGWVEEHPNGHDFFALANFYQYKDTERFTQYTIRAAQTHYEPAIQHLVQHLKDNAYTLYFIAQYQELGHLLSANLPQAITLYTQAACRGNTNALDRLHQLAAHGDAQAQYQLGTQYYLANQQFQRAIDYCLLAAAQQHAGAIAYLTTSELPAAAYTYLGYCYDKGHHTLSISQLTAYRYYQKAYQHGEEHLAYRLGELALVQQQPANQQFNPIAWDYFVAAAKQGHPFALCLLLLLLLLLLLVAHGDKTENDTINMLRHQHRTQALPPPIVTLRHNEFIPSGSVISDAPLPAPNNVYQPHWD